MEANPKIDADAWVDHYGDALFHFARARVKNREIAEDLVQETFLAAVKSQDRFKGRSSEKTWLFGILKHKVIDHYHQNKSILYEQGLNQGTADLDTFFNAKGAWQIFPEHWRLNPGKSQAVREFIDHFYQCLADLPNRTADVFAFREIDGLSTEEISNQLIPTPRNPHPRPGFPVNAKNALKKQSTPAIKPAFLLTLQQTVLPLSTLDTGSQRRRESLYRRPDRRTLGYHPGGLHRVRPALFRIRHRSQRVQSPG